MKNEINIDCYGGYYGDGWSEIILEDYLFRFVFADDKKQGLAFHYAMFTSYIATSLSGIRRYPVKRRIALLVEPGSGAQFVIKPHLAMHFQHVFTYNRKLLERKQNYRMQLYGTKWVPDHPGGVYEKQHLVSFVGGKHENPKGGHIFRNEVVDFLLNTDVRSHCYGKGIKPVKSKLEALSGYCFSITMENGCEDYYFTEKIIDCFFCDTVPLYWGCPSIAEFFDYRGMIIFKNIDDLHSIINGLSHEKWKLMLPYVQINRKKAEDMLLSDPVGFNMRIARSLLELEAPINCRPIKIRPTLYNCLARYYRGLRRLSRTVVANHTVFD